MAKTIEQIQALIDAKIDARQLINLLADYLQANPGGNTIYTADGALAGDRRINLNEFYLFFEYDANQWQFDWGGFTTFRMDDEIGASIIELNANVGDGYYFLIASQDGVVNPVSIKGDGQSSTITHTADTHTFNGKIVSPTVLAANYANDAAAGVGGIPVGGIYHTSGTLKIRLS